MTSPVGSDAWADEQAVAAAVPGARGWFRIAEGLQGAVNARLSGALTAAQYDDQQWRVLAQGAQSFTLAGPFESGEHAEAVLAAALRLAYDDAAWPQPQA